MVHLNIKTSFLHLTAALAASLVLCQCAATPQSRIQSNPQTFGQLGPRDRQLVASGSIREGMSRDAVYLGWGRPDRVSAGSSHGRKTESWTYLGQTPVTSYNVGAGFGWGGWGGGPYGWGWGGYPYWNTGPSTTYVPYTRSKVDFTNGRVSKWITTPRS